MKTLVFILTLFCAPLAYAQQFTQIISDEKLDSLIQKDIELNKESSTMPGYRIQIFFGSERKEALDARTKFLQLFPETEAYLVYQAPYFKVRVGDYRNKLEAQAVYRTVLNEFDKIFIVPDKINLPKL